MMIKWLPSFQHDVYVLDGVGVLDALCLLACSGAMTATVVCLSDEHDIPCGAFNCSAV